MEQNETFPEAQTLGALAETRKRLAAVEAQFKEERAMSRRLCLSLIVDYGYSINKVYLLSGHNRQTIETWLAAAGVRIRK